MEQSYFKTKTKGIANQSRIQVDHWPLLSEGTGIHNYLFGIQFTILTDKKPLSSMFDLVSSTVLPQCIQRLAFRLLQYSFKIQHISGKANTADPLSRLPSMCETAPIAVLLANNMSDFCTIATCYCRPASYQSIRHEARDSTLSKLVALIRHGKWSCDDKLKPFKTIKEELSV